MSDMVKNGDTVKIVNSPDQPSLIGQHGRVTAVFNTPFVTVKVYIKGQAILYLTPQDIEVVDL